jgi:acyl-CoA dehydrogenase
LTDLTVFRAEAKVWLEQNCPPSQRKPVVKAEQIWSGRKREFHCQDAKLWFERCRDKGYTVADWPVEYGGAGLSQLETKALKDEMNSLGCRPPLYDLGIWMLGPALLEFGNDEQRKQHLPKIARGEIRWCQGYSEPGAGSDLASLQCKAEDKGDYFLVNGAKIWTTWADKADWIFCLVRTDNGATKQEGISFVLIDMDDPGINVSPISLISGESEFCQTFFDNVKVPKKNLVAELNQGWSVAKGLLKHERKLMSEIGGDVPSPGITPVKAAMQYLPMTDGKIGDANLRAKLVAHEMTMRAIGLTHFRSFEERISGNANKNIPLIMKYIGTEEMKNKAELMLACLGTQGLGWEGNEYTDDELMVTRGWLFSKTMSIAGGTNEVQLNIIAKQALGLPD